MRKSRKGQQVALGMSGGIDSSIALFLLKKNGFYPVGVSFKINEDNDFKSAEKICKKYNIPHYIIDHRKEFKNTVVDYFKKELEKNKTPNPCLFCNKEFKLKKLIEFADKKNTPFISTGHYARVKFNKKKKKYQLLQGKDKKKDQSYFLALLGNTILERLVLPLGNLTKEKVKEIAQKEELYFLLDKKQSQDLCFIEGKSKEKFIKENINNKSGSIVNQRGKKIGEHSGLSHFTIGQRKGIGLANGPWFVTGFNKEKNILKVTNDSDSFELFSKKVKAKNYFFSDLPKKVKGKIRYNQNLEKAKVIKKNSKIIEVEFKNSQRATTPGQWLVLYKGETCLGGGEIF